MSDSCMYELDDILLEHFGDNDDHIVPLTGGQKNGYGIEGDGSKRHKCELTSTENKVASKSALETCIRRKEESRLCAVKDEKEIMLENNSMPHSSSAVVSALLGGESKTKTSHSTSTESMTSQCLARTNIDCSVSKLNSDPIVGDQTSFVDNNMHHYQLNNASHTENDLDLFDQESNDLLCFRWPEMDNFENVDEMFRSCDSMFGLEVDNDEELDWFSPSQAVLAGSDDVSTSNFNISEFNSGGINNEAKFQEVYGSDNAGFVVDEIGKKLTPVDWKRYSQKFTSDSSSIVMNTSCSNGSEAVPKIEGDPQVCSRVSKLKNQNLSDSEGQGKEHSLSNGETLHFGDLKQEGDLDQSLNFQCTFWEETEQKQNIEPHACLQTSIPLINSYTGHPSNQVLARPKSSIIKSKHSSFPSLSSRKSSSKSNQVQATKSSRDVSLQHSSGHKRKERASQRRSKAKRADSDPVSVQTQVPNFESEVEGEVNGSDSGIPGELDSFTIRGSSCMRSVLDEVTVEESSFQLLQHALQQLDLKTKLCIRDSLYRLARSAEQRHKWMYPTSASKSSDDQNQSRTFTSDELNKSAGFVDIETNTNPIDRSIAHLLFHRPSDPSATTTVEVGPMKLAHAAEVMAEKFDGEGETTQGNIKLLKDESKDCEFD